MSKKKVEYDVTKKERNSGYRGSSGHGYAYVYIKCPFCSTTTRAFAWSLAGSGKICDGCGAKHTSFGYTFPIKK